jgi:hypothetical protein
MITRSLVLLATGATAFDYLGSLTVKDTAIKASPTKDAASYLESMAAAAPAATKPAVAAPAATTPVSDRAASATVLIPNTDPIRDPTAAQRQEASSTWDAARRKAQGTPRDYAARAEEWVRNDGFHAPAKTELMSDEFVWFGPLVGPLNKQDFLGTVSMFKISEGFPDLKMHLSAFTRDPVEENRYWSILRLEGTHTEPLESGTGAPPYKPTGNKLDVGPQAVSVTFDADGKVSRYTGGYIVDINEGSTGMNGGFFAIMKTVGGFTPGRRVAKLLNAVGALLKNFPKNRSRREDLPLKWQSLGRGFGKRSAESWD